MKYLQISKTCVCVCVTWQVYCSCVWACTALYVSSPSQRSSRRYGPTLDGDLLGLDLEAEFLGVKHGDRPAVRGGGTRRALLTFGKTSCGSSSNLFRQTRDLTWAMFICDWTRQVINEQVINYYIWISCLENVLNLRYSTIKIFITTVNSLL